MYVLSASRRQYLQEVRGAGAPRPGHERHCLLRHGRHLGRGTPAADRTPLWLLSATDAPLLRVDWSDLFLFQFNMCRNEKKEEGNIDVWNGKVQNRNNATHWQKSSSKSESLIRRRRMQLCALEKKNQLCEELNSDETNLELTRLKNPCYD